MPRISTLATIAITAALGCRAQALSLCGSCSVPAAFLTQAAGHEKSFAAQLALHGFQPSIGQNGKSFGSQLTSRVFRMGSPNQVITLNEQFLGFGGASKFRLGIYSADQPSEISWVLGDTMQNGKRASEWSGKVLTGQGQTYAFGFVLQTPSNLIYSDPLLNRDSELRTAAAYEDHFDMRQHAVVVQDSLRAQTVFGFESSVNAGAVQYGGCLDFADYGFSATNLIAGEGGASYSVSLATASALCRPNSVPEPSSWAVLLGFGGLFLAQQRRSAARSKKPI